MISGVIEIWDSCWFSGIVRHIRHNFLVGKVKGGLETLPYIFLLYFSFFHSATASSSQRLFLGLVAWPFTQW